MSHVSAEIKRAFLRSAHNGDTKEMLKLLNKTNYEHDANYNNIIVGLPSKSIVFERKRLLRENKSISKHITKYNLINVVDHRLRRSALHWACEKGKLSATKIALNNGININKVDVNGQTGLHIICKHGKYLEILLILLDAGAKLNIVDCNGYTPLMLATINGHVDVVRILLMYGANIYVETNARFKKKTAVDLAYDKKHENILQLLLRHVYNER
jgi:hypothetical protein